MLRKESLAQNGTRGQRWAWPGLLVDGEGGEEPCSKEAAPPCRHGPGSQLRVLESLEMSEDGVRLAPSFLTTLGLPLL